MKKTTTSWLKNALLLSLLAVLPATLHAQTWQWLATHSSASTGTSVVNATTIDGAGNIVVAGTFAGTITLGSTTLTSAGGADIFVGRLDAGGAWTQAVRAGGPGSETPYSVAVDNSGNVVVAGTFTGATLTFDATTLTNAFTGTTAPTGDIFVARLNPAGAWTQAVRVGGPNDETLRGLALDATGTATIAGGFISTSVAFGTTTLANADNRGITRDIYVARLSSAGIWTQALRVGSVDFETPMAMAQDAAGTVYLAGSFSGMSATFGSTTIANSDRDGFHPDIFVARLSPAGTWTLAVSAGGTFCSENPQAIAVDGSGNVTITGNYGGGSSTFGSTTLASPGGAIGGFVARLGLAGTWQMAANAGSPGLTLPVALAVDASGNTTIVGQLGGTTAQFGSISANSSSTTGNDFFIARLNTAGTWTYALRAGTSGNDNANAVFLTGSTALISGTLQTPTTAFGFGTTPIVATTLTAFVGRLSGVVSATRATTTPQPLVFIPNPAAASRQVSLTGLVAADAPTAIVVIDRLGRQVYRHALPAHATAATLDLRGLAPGLYVVRCGAAAGPGGAAADGAAATVRYALPRKSPARGAAGSGKPR